MGDRNDGWMMAETGQSMVRAVVVLLGAALLVAGVVVVATNYSDDYSCAVDLRCHGANGLEPTVADRAAVAFGFGIEKTPSSDLPGPEGAVLLVTGFVLLLGGMVVRRPASSREAVVERPATPATPAAPTAPRRRTTVEDPGPRQRVFLDR